MFCFQTISMHMGMGTQRIRQAIPFSFKLRIWSAWTKFLDFDLVVKFDLALTWHLFIYVLINYYNNNNSQIIPASVGCGEIPM